MTKRLSGSKLDDAICIAYLRDIIMRSQTVNLGSIFGALYLNMYQREVKLTVRL